MWRRVVYAVNGIVAVNVVMMAAMFLHGQNENDCDVEARGSVIWHDDAQQWLPFEAPTEPTDLPPCRYRSVTEHKLVLEPG